jgi:hypothetical protein
VAIECDHPRPPLALPGYTPVRLAWQPPTYIPDLAPNAARVLREALQGVYQELGKLGQTRNVIPLYEDVFARPGSVIQGVGNGQTITLASPGASGYVDPVSILLTDVSSPVNVVHPDGTVTSIASPGAYTFEPTGADEAYATDTASLILAGAVPTDTLLGRDTAGTGEVEFITLTAPLEFDGTGKVRLAPQAADTFLGNIGTTSAVPGAVALADIDSASVIYDATTHTFQRAALTGFAVASQNGNATTSAEPIVTYSASANMSAERVLSAGTNTTISTAVAGQISVGVDDLPLSALADISAGTIVGRAVNAGTGVPTALTGLQAGAIVRWGTEENITISGAAQTATVADTTTIADFLGTGDLVGITPGSAAQSGRILFFKHTAGGGTTTTIKDTATAGASEGIRTPGQVDFVIGAGSGGLNLVQGFLYKDPTDTDGRWYVFPRGHSRAEDIAWTGSHSFTSTSFVVSTTADISLATGAGGGFGVFAGHTAADVAGGDLVLNAAGGISIRADTTTPVVSVTNGVFALETYGDAWFSTTAGGLALSTEAAHPTGVTNGLILLDSSAAITLDATTQIALNTAGAQRLTIEADGSWNIGGSNGTLGHTIVSAGSSAPPAWGQLGTVGIADDSVTPAKLAPEFHTLAGAGPHADVAIADTVTTIVLLDTGTLTSIAGGWQGRRIAVLTNGGDTLSISHASGSAGNQIATPDALTYSSLRGGALLEYETTSGTGAWRFVASAGVSIAGVTLAKMANLAQATIIGRASGAGTGVPTALTGAQVRAIIGGAMVARTVYTSGSGTHTMNAATTRAVVTVVGGGAGGGGVEGATGVGYALGGGGGAGAHLTLNITSNLGSHAYVVGAGGTGVAGLGGNDGDDSSFHDGTGTRTAPGGSGGGLQALSFTSGFSAGGPGGTRPSSGGSVVERSGGNPGHSGWRVNLESLELGVAGHGGAGPWGGAGIGVDSNSSPQDGGDATGYGAGGGGAYGSGSTTDRAGGDGFAGIVIVEEFSG